MKFVIVMLVYDVQFFKSGDEKTIIMPTLLFNLNAARYNPSNSLNVRSIELIVELKVNFPRFTNTGCILLTKTVRLANYSSST